MLVATKSVKLSNLNMNAKEFKNKIHVVCPLLMTTMMIIIVRMTPTLYIQIF